MKRRRIKGWVMVVLGIMLLAILIHFSQQSKRNAIAECVNGGNTINFCEYHLGK